QTESEENSRTVLGGRGAALGGPERKELYHRGHRGAAEGAESTRRNFQGERREEEPESKVLSRLPSKLGASRTSPSNLRVNPSRLRVDRNDCGTRGTQDPGTHSVLGAPGLVAGPRP